MGMYLALAAVSDSTIEHLHADPPLVWQLITPDEPERVAAARAELRPSPGLLTRLFGRGSAPPPEPEPPPLQLGSGEGDLGALGDMDKAWHGVHYLLTGTAWEGEPPLNFLLGGGREVDIEAGQAPVLTHSSAETRAIAAALSAVSDGELRARYNPAEMMRLEIYPEVWDREPEEQAREYLMEAIGSLRELLDIVVTRGYGLMVSIT